MADSQEDKILYDLLLPEEEWPDSITLLNEPVHSSLLKMAATMFNACKWFTLELIKNPASILFGVQFSPSVLADIINSRLSWLLAISSDGKQLAIARDDCIEIRSILDNFEVPRTILKIDKDTQPKWRKMSWNRHGNSLAYANSLGEVTVFANFGKTTHKLVESVGSPSSSSDNTLLNMAVSGLLFINKPTTVGGATEPSPQHPDDDDSNKGRSPLELLVVVGYNGHVTTFQADVRTTGYVKLHVFNMSSYFPCGVGAVEYVLSHNLMVLAGWSDATASEQDPSTPVSCWRLMDSQPYWRPPPGQEMRKSRGSTLKQLMGKKSPNPNSLFALTVSPDELHVAGISLSGDLTLWHLPSCRLKAKWNSEEMFNSSSVDSKPLKGPVIPLEVQWWSNKALIVADSRHNVTVPSIDTLSNLLGQYAEPGAAITPALHDQFLMLECNSNEVWERRDRLLPSLSDMEDSDKELETSLDDSAKQQELDDVAEYNTVSLKSKMSTIAKQLLYFLTEMDKFKPPSKRLRKLINRYTLVCVKSMMPEECYERKMKNEEYGEALALAKRYNLDCDLVYQHQWQKCPVVTKAAISDYLSRVSKKTWVLQECLHCVAEDFLTMKELILFGLHCTEFNEIMGTDEDNEDSLDDVDSPVKTAVSNEVAAKLITERGSLSEDQIFLCQCRQSLLQYLERLNTYEIILGGPAATFELYNAQFFKKFREQNLVSVSMEYAQDGNYCAVEALFNRHGDTVLPHRLAILANFPETLDPKIYSYLLPEIDDDENMKEWVGDSDEEVDWVEYPPVRKLYSFNRQTSFGEFIYEENPDLKKYMVSPVSHDLVKAWYSERATQIEEYSGQVDSALAIIKIGLDKQIKGLDMLHYNLQTLYTLIYHCNVDVRLSLPQVQSMSHLDIVQLMMKDVDQRDFVTHFNRYCIPYISRLRSIDLPSSLKLLEEFMIVVSKTDLRPCVGFLRSVEQSSSSGATNPFKLTPDQTVNIGLKCVLASERNDQLDKADAILECLIFDKTDSSSSELKSSLQQQVDQLKNFLFAAGIMQKYGVQKPVYFFKNIQENSSEAEKMIVRVTRVASRKTPSLSETGWRTLLRDIVTLRDRVCKTLKQDVCYKIFAESMLCSGNSDNIKLAGHIIRPTPSASPHTKGFNYTLPFGVSVDVVTMAAREYINSATSPNDKEIDFARLCVSLIEVHPLPLQLTSELNLILALEILDEFGITMLPINVRLCDNKLDIIRQVLDSSSNAYKKYEKILQLSYLLGHSTEPEDYCIDDLLTVPKVSDGKGYTIVIIALTAIQFTDYRLASTLCTVLMKCKFEHAWEVCKQLGSDDKYTDKDTKLHLLNFSLCHCPTEEIQVILREKRILDTKISLDECHCLNDVEQGKMRQIMEKGSHTLQHFVSQGASQIISRQKQQTGNVPPVRLYGESHKEVLSKCVETLSQMVNERRRKKQLQRTSVPITLSYHPFYPSNEVKNESKSYMSWQESVSSSLDIVLHQTILSLFNNWRSLSEKQDELEECLADIVHHHSLETLVSQLLNKDIHFSISCLLSVKAEEFNSICSLFPESCKLSHQIPLYVSCLKLYYNFTTLSDSTRYHPFDHDPSLFIDHVTCCVNWFDQFQGNESFVGHLLRYNESLKVYLEEKTLQSLNQNIDVDLFFVEETYRKQTILRLARDNNPKIFEVSIYFAGRYDIDKWKVFMAQLNWLMTQSGLSADEITERTSQFKLMNTLLSQPQKLADELIEKVYDILPSTRYSLLYQYYTFLQWAVEKGATVSDLVSVATHLKILKSFKKTIREINYHQLMKGEDPLSVLVPSLRDHNVKTIANLSSDIPIKDGGYLSAEMIYGAFVVKKFRQEEADSDISNEALRARLNECREYISLLDTHQFKNVVIEIIFSRKSLQLSFDIRINLLNIFIDISSHKIANEPKSSSSSFKKLTSELNLYKKHLESLKHSNLRTAPPKFSKDIWKSVVEEYDLSLAVTDQVLLLAKRICIHAVPVLTINTLLMLSNDIRAHDLTVKGVVQQSLIYLLTSETCSNNGRPIERDVAVEGIMISVANYEKESDPAKLMVCSSDVLDTLRPICSSHEQSPMTKRTLLHLMNKHLSLSKENFGLLLAYQTQSIVSEDFENIEITTDQLLTEEKQLELFSSLLQQSTTIQQLDKLGSLLLSWPNSNSGGPFLKCWCDLIFTIARHDDNGSGQKAVAMRSGLQGVQLKDDENTFNILFKKDKRSAIQFALISPHNELLQEILDQLSPEELMSIVDNTTMEMILHTKDAVSRIISTPFYELLYGYLTYVNVDNSAEQINQKSMASASPHKGTVVIYPSERVTAAVEILKSNGLPMEAGSLMLLAQGAHEALSHTSSTYAKLFH